MASVRMADIAARVGASRSAVSFVLNGRARDFGISPELEARVITVARELDYRPSMVARSLASRRTMTLGILLPDLSRSYNPMLCGAVVGEAESHGYQVIVHHHGDDPDRFDRAWRTLVGWNVDGVVVIPIVGKPGLRARATLRDSDTPVVLVTRDLNDPAIPVVIPDVARAAEMGVDCLTRLGHRRIALMPGPGLFLETRRREQGYRTAMKRAGLRVARAYVVHTPAEGDVFEGGAAAADRVLSLKHPPTALVINNNVRALGVLRRLSDRGVRVPDDLSIVLLSGRYTGDAFPVRFTRVDTDNERAGRVAVQRLLGRIESSGKSRRGGRTLIKPSMYAGETVAPPAAAR